VTRVILSAALLLLSAPASAQSCGLPPLPPLPPLGCHRLEPVCYCDAYGHCRWEWVVSASHGATAH